jgi:hypothetical protein
LQFIALKHTADVVLKIAGMPKEKTVTVWITKIYPSAEGRYAQLTEKFTEKR